jgi:hypothetical protein
MFATKPLKQTTATLLLISIALLSLAAALPNIVTAQTGYSISEVEHTIGVLYSGNLVILDTVHVVGAVEDGFLIALPYTYSADVLKVLAYDGTNSYDVNVGVQLPGHSGFYGVSVNFNGATPSQFTVAFVLSNSLTIDQGGGNFLVDFPAYPALTKPVDLVDVNLICPTTPTSITISKDDGNAASTRYIVKNLPAYTYATAEATLKFSPGTIQKATLQRLDRVITVTATGGVTATDSIQLINNASSALTAFIVSLPSDATGLDVRDASDTSISYNTSQNSGMLLVNTTFASPIPAGQTTTLTVHYNLPDATPQGSGYALSELQFFSKYQYVIQNATATFHLPDGATITSPTASALSSASTLIRSTYQDSLTVAAETLSYVDSFAPQERMVLTYTYNPVWVSLSATFYASLAAALCVVGWVVYRWRWPKQTFRPISPPIRRGAVTTETPVYETVKGAQITPEIIHEFIGAYEDKKHLSSELHALDMKGLRNKIPRRQYKAQRSALEVRMAEIMHTLEQNKALFRGASGMYPDLVKQLEVAEADLTYAQDTLSTLEVRQSNGEISLETYKKSIIDAQRTRDKAELVINGILSRLREKIR